MSDHIDDTGNYFTNAIRLGLVLAAVLMMIMWLTTCSGRNKAVIEDVQNAAEARESQLRQEADSKANQLMQQAESERTAAISSLKESHQTEVSGLKQQISELDNVKTQFESSLLDATSKLEIATGRISELETVNSGMESRLSELSQETEALGLALSETKSELSGANTQISDLSSLNQALESQVLEEKSSGEANIQSLTSNFETENADLAQKVKELARQVESLYAEKTTLGLAVAEKTAEIQSLRNNSDQLTSETADPVNDDSTDELVAELSTLKAINEDLTSDLKGREQELAEINEQYSALSTQYETLKTSTENEQQDRSEQVTELTALTSKNSGLITELDAKSTEMASLNEKTVSIRHELDSAIAELESLTKTNENLKAQLADKDKISASDNEKLLKLTQQIDSSNSQINSLNANLDALTTEKADLVAQIETSAVQLKNLNNELEALNSEKAVLETKSTTSSDQIRTLKEELEVLNAEKTELTAKLAASSDQMKTLNSDLELMAAEKIDIQSRLKTASDALNISRLELVSLRESVQDKDNTLNDVQAKLAAMPEQGQPTEAALKLEESIKKQISSTGLEGAVIEIHGENTVGIKISSGTLFRSGRSEITVKGKAVMNKLASVLKDYSSHDIRIEGHTDNVPVGAALQPVYPTNWELSVARAAAAARLLQDAGVSSEALSATGYAEHRPIGENDSPEGRNANRRIEVMLTPRP